MTAVTVLTQRRAFFTPKSLAQYLAVSERTVRSMLAKGTIPSYLIEGSRRVDPADVDAYLTDRRTVGGPLSGPGVHEHPGPWPKEDQLHEQHQS
jgi:excisionase family DNA binding protein